MSTMHFVMLQKKGQIAMVGAYIHSHFTLMIGCVSVFDVADAAMMIDGMISLIFTLRLTVWRMDRCWFYSDEGVPEHGDNRLQCTTHCPSCVRANIERNGVNEGQSDLHECMNAEFSFPLRPLFDGCLRCVSMTRSPRH